MDVVNVPVGGILGHDPLDLGLEGGQDEGPAVEQGLGAGAEAVAALGQELAVDGHEGGPAQHGQEVGAGGVQGVDQGIGVSGLHADVLHGHLGHLLDDLAVRVELDGIAVLIGAVGGGLQLQQVGGVGVIGRGVGHLGHLKVILAGGVVGGVQDVVGGVHPVLGGDVGHLIAVLVHPLDPLADVEGPLGVVLVVLPALSQGGLDHAVAVVLHQGVHHIGGDLQVAGGGGVQVVHGLHLGGVKGAVDGGAVASAARVAAGGQGQDHSQSQQQGRCALLHFHLFHSFPFEIRSIAGMGQRGGPIYIWPAGQI